ncbi:FAD/NAD(P)-binding domain-containing protein [Coniochaeta ligniaria NRRL 30616]|uniref:FAD/NAD(P)-binding domain-containing protein n=1 Tax=Coniochaeta ligniaria NRRL 30616 TaxID=1408157 RepID=A0A1J7JLG9_9PEZI|nr:FAD/NAD(P)-binding domain-containing protein [Coniochaeta ligniaria NRRL 30616]
MRVAVIGAGPSGLVTLKYLKTAHQFFPIKPIETLLFEAEDAVGGTFTHRTYEDAELVSSKQLTTFSDFRPRKDDPDFLSAERYVEYLKQYCDHFDLWPSINLSTPVLSVRRRTGDVGGHVIHYRKDGKEMTWECDAVAVCSGLHVTPSIPNVPGIENVPVVKHSAEFKSREEFGTDKTIVVLGTGETGIDLAYLAVTSPTKRVLLCHRDGFLGAPKRMLTPVTFPILGRKPDPNYVNVPVDCSQATLFDSMYVHPLMRDTMFLWHYYDVLIKVALWITTGSYHGYDQWVAGISPQRYHSSKVFFNKAAAKAIPYISAPYRPAKPSLVQRIRSSIIQCDLEPVPPGRAIEMAPWPSHIDANGRIHFRDNGRPEYDRLKDEVIVPDVLFYATGYTQTFPFLDAETGDRPYPHADDANVREIWRADDPTVAFLGFIRPAFGAIPTLSEMQVQLWIMKLVAPDQIPRPLEPKDEGHYRLRPPPGARINYGVDHETYAYQLALDIGSAPSFTEVVAAGWKASRGGNGLWWRLPVVWAAGAQFNAKFRMRGPYKWDGAVNVLGVELWETISRRGGFLGNFTLAVIPIVFLGTINLGLYVYSTVVDTAATVFRVLTSPFAMLWRKKEAQRTDYVRI